MTGVFSPLIPRFVRRRRKEAGAGIEPANSGFADRDLTTWLPRRYTRADNIVVAALVSSADRRYVGVRRGERFYKFSRFNASTL